MSEYALRLSDEERMRYRFMAEAAMHSERDRWEAAGIVPGATVADIGCGPGAMSAVLATMVGEDGHVWAVDGDPEAVESARRAAAMAGVSNVTVTHGDATETGVESSSVDVVMIRHVLAHNGGREDAIVSHAASLVRPGGSVYLVDIEGGGLTLRPTDDDLEDLQATYARWHAKQGNDLSVGLRLAELLTAAGLEVTAFHGYYNIVESPPGMRPPGWAGREAMVASGVATPADVARWGAALERMDAAQPRPTLFAPIFLATGRRPH